MKLSKYAFFVFLFFIIITTAKAQEPIANKGSISDQFDYIIRKSTNFNESGQTYEVVKLDLLLYVKKQALDSIKVIQTKLEDSRNSVSPLQAEIKNLKNNLSESEKSLALIKQEKDEMTLLGMQLSKTNYNLVMWTIITLLFVFLLFFIYRFKNSNAITKNAQTSLENLEIEYEEHRTLALAREQKVMRQLQDELNKQKKS